MSSQWLLRVVMLGVLGTIFPAASFANFNVGITVDFAPPALPAYVQPACPASGYLWTPGYWAYSYDDGDYYWVPGTWVVAPSPGLLWTPGYWAELDEQYVWRAGYWAPHVGFYGGINYGFGYFGVGYAGGYWRDRDFFYNRAVTNISNVNIINVYNRTITNNYVDGTRLSFNGGDGIRARPTRGELLAEHEPHRGFTQPQRLQAESARTVPALLASVNHGHPAIAATARPVDFRRVSNTPARPLNGWSSELPRAATSATAPWAANTATRSATAPRHDAASRPLPAPRYDTALRSIAAPRYYDTTPRTATRSMVAPRYGANAPVAPPHIEPRAIATRWPAPPAFRAPSQNFQASRHAQVQAPRDAQAPLPRIAQVTRLNQPSAAPSRREAPRPPPAPMPMQRRASPPRTIGPAPLGARDHRGG